jgi:hypothetical protein
MTPQFDLLAARVSASDQLFDVENHFSSIIWLFFERYMIIMMREEREIKHPLNGLPFLPLELDLFFLFYFRQPNNKMHSLRFNLKIQAPSCHLHATESDPGLRMAKEVRQPHRPPT